MVKCVVLDCKNYHGKKGISKTIKFFCFPKDISVAKIWLKYCGKFNNLNDESARICSEHFTNDDYTLRDILLNIPLNKRRLKSNAIPSQNLGNYMCPSERQQRYQEKVQKQDFEDAITIFKRQEQENINQEMSEVLNCKEIQTDYRSCKIRINKINKLVATKGDSKDRPTIGTPTDTKYKLEQACRTCATFFNNTLFPIFDNSISIVVTLKNDSDHLILNVLDELMLLDSNLMIEKNDNLPQQICLECIQQLSNIHKFREQCQVSQITLKEYYFNKQNYENFENPIETISNTIDNIRSENSFSENEKEEKVFLPETRDDDKDQEETTDNDFNESDNEMLTRNGKQFEEVLVENNENTVLELVETTMSPLVIQCEKCNKFTYSVRHRRICNNLIKGGKGNIADGIDSVCFYCNEAFESYNDVENHILKIHSVEEPFICRICKETFPNLSKRSEHMKCHNDKDELSCDICFQAFQHLGQLQSHRRDTHLEKPFECKKCSKRFTRKTGYRSHMRLIHETDRPHKCKYCGKSFLFASRLKIHERIHTKERPYKCDQCDKSFRVSSDYNIHMAAHKGVRFICEMCGKEVISKMALYKHKLTHKDTPLHQCEQCGKYFKSIYTLRYHSSIHTGDKKSYLKKREILYPYKCPTCSKRFSTASSFENHMRIHNENWKFVCNDCGKAFRLSKQLKAHVDQIHLKKYWRCRYCQQKFTDFSVKDAHVKFHENDAHPCSHCGKVFKLSYVLQKHERIHIGERKHECLVCGEYFSDGVFIKHQRKHSLEEHKKAQERILANSIYQIEITPGEKNDKNDCELGIE